MTLILTHVHQIDFSLRIFEPLSLPFTQSLLTFGYVPLNYSTSDPVSGPRGRTPWKTLCKTLFFTLVINSFDPTNRWSRTGSNLGEDLVIEGP